MSELRIMFKNEIWDKDRVHALLDNNPQAVGRALMVVYNNQTADEKSAETTKHHNGVGFTGADAEWLSDVAKKWIKWGRWASDRQCAAVRKAIKKYHRQILEQMLQANADARAVSAKFRIFEEINP